MHRKMTSSDRRRTMAYLTKENKKFTGEFVCLRNMEPEEVGPGAPIQAWRNNKFLAQVYVENGFLRISVNRTQINYAGDWLDGITWDDLFMVKNAIGFEDMEFVEVFPARKDLTYVANIRHLFLCEELPFVWRLQPDPIVEEGNKKTKTKRSKKKNE